MGKRPHISCKINYIYLSSQMSYHLMLNDINLLNC